MPPGPARRRSLHRTTRRAVSRLAADAHVLLALALVFAALAVEVISGSDPAPIVVPIALYLVVQMTITISTLPRRRSRLIDTVRLLLAVAAVVALSLRAGGPVALPLAALYIPIVAMAAAIGWAPAGIVATAALAGFAGLAGSVGPVEPVMVQRFVSLMAAMLVLVIGTRRTVASLERAVAHARSAMAGQRRRARQMSAVEAVGRMLAANGPSPAALDNVMELLVSRFGYRYVSIYTVDGAILRLGAQRGYAHPVETFEAAKGVVGRVMRTGLAAFVRDVTTDPDYHAADPEVTSEVAVPLLADGRVIGVLNVESTVDAPLDESDRDMMILVGDRVAAALELGRERQALRERAELLTRLVDFGTAINASLEADRVQQAIVDAVAVAIETDIVGLVLRVPGSGDDRLVAMHGADPRYIGVRILPGEGMAGQAMVSRTVVHSDALNRADYPSTMRGAQIADRLATVAIPLVTDDELLGALSLSRTDLTRPFTTLEIEALGLIAAQVALALRNTALHALVAEAAIRDPLTGLWNRRQLDVSLDRLFAVRARQALEDRRPVAAILFDLDHFGAFNNRHGHVAGDLVLRAFGAILARRLRSSDVVARFGGEEFVAVLDGASLDEARRVADEIRRELENTQVTNADGEVLVATVSAGCASLGPDVTSFETLLEVADVGLQMAKRGGRNQVVAA
ncbi:MAG: diguanylate cyclase [Candidatus Limnocylindrales bacterium]